MAKCIDGIIIYEPLEIWGYDEKNLPFGILIGTTEDVTYRWYKYDTLASSGSMNMIVVNEPGIYSCEVSFADIMQISKPLNISDVSISLGGYSTLTTADSPKLAHPV